MPCWRSSATSTRSRRSPGSRSTSAPSPPTTVSVPARRLRRRPRRRRPLREHLVEEVPSRAVMQAYLLPLDGTREADAADLALTVLGSGESSRLYNRLVRRDRLSVTAGFGLLRLAGAPSLGWLDSKTSGEATVEAVEAAIDEELARFAAEGPPRRNSSAPRRRSSASGWTAWTPWAAARTNCAATPSCSGTPSCSTKPCPRCSR
ncbi:insulinase family protein [Streptacidiphilus monticola]